MSATPLRRFAEWVADLDRIGNEERRTITLTKIINEANRALNDYSASCKCVHPSHCEIHRGQS